jgi:hypothetical protein
MMRINLLIFLLIILFCLEATHAPADLRFAVLCDSRSSMEHVKCRENNGGVSPTLVMDEDILDKHKVSAINLMLFPGDMMAGHFKSDAASVAECNRVSLTRWREIVKPALDAGIALRVTIGNHEILAPEPSLASVRCGRIRQRASLSRLVFKS